MRRVSSAPKPRTQEYARLLDLGEVDGDVAVLRFERHGQDDFVRVLPDGVRHAC